MSSHLVICCVLSLASLTTLVTSQQDGPVELRWGIADGSAVVGRLFQMHIPGDAFSGKVVSYEVKTSSGDPLPAWIDFDSDTNVLQGIPLRKDSTQLELEVTAKGEETSQASSTFTIVVRDVPSLTSGAPVKSRKQSSNSGPEIVRCKREEPETVATMIIDADMESSHVKDRLTLLNKFLGHMNLHHDMVKMIPVGNSPLHDSSALVSGTGDCTDPKTPGLFISWPVGCGQVKEGHFPVLQRLDDDSSNGKMAGALGYSVIGWRVSNSHLQAPKRKRRQAAQATATPVLTPVMPTKTETTGVITEDPMTREIPVVKSSAVVIQPTATQPAIAKTQVPTMMTTPTTEEMIQPTTPMEKVKVTTEKTETLPPVKEETTEKRTEATTTPKTAEPATVDPGFPSCIKGQKPKVGKSFSKLTYNVGDVIDYVIPADAFEDCEVGGTRGLILLLLKDSTTEIPPDFFVQFDPQSQRIFGLPMDADVNRYKMNLVARKGSLVVPLPFTLVIKGTKNKKKINHELSVAIDLDYDEFVSNVTQKIELANKVASIYGDSDASNLVITNMKRGSVLYSWANKTLSSNSCPVGGISAMVSALVNEDGSLSENAIEKMKPYVLMGASSAPSGACEDDPNFPAVTSKPRMPDVSSTASTDTVVPPVKSNVTIATVDKVDTTGKDMPEEETTTAEPVASGSTGGDDIMITTVVPAIVIVVILLIALLIACVLYRKKRKGKMNVEEQNTFVNKGTPVIFPDELEDKPNDVNKPLLVECNTAPPPEYHSRGTSESPERDAVAANNHRNNATPGNAPQNSTHDDNITEEKPYDPPPPVAASSNNKQPRPTQQPMSQHPQILP